MHARPSTLLPNELLDLILKYYVAPVGHHMGSYILSAVFSQRVCRLWCNVVRSIPALWTSFQHRLHLPSLVFIALPICQSWASRLAFPHCICMDPMHICNRGILILQKLSTLRIYVDSKATARDAAKSVIAMRPLVEIQDAVMMHLAHCVAEVKALFMRDPQLSPVRYLQTTETAASCAFQTNV